MGIQGKYYQRFPSLSFFISLISKYFQDLGKVHFFYFLDLPSFFCSLCEACFMKVQTGVQPGRLEMAICK